MDKQQQYKAISKKIIDEVGGKDNIQGVAHCATRLRIVLKDDSLADLTEIENTDLVKGVFVAGDQLQIIFGSGLVNDIYRVFSEEAGNKDMSLNEVKDVSARKQNPFQQAIKALSDVFIDIMPAILAAALLMGLSGLFTTENLFGTASLIQRWPALEGTITFVNLVSSSVFGLLPLLVIYSATKRFGGRAIMGLAVGTVMMNSSLADAFQVAQGNATAEVLNIFGLKISLIGFQGGIVIALMMGFVVAKLDMFFEDKVPNSIKLLFSPMLTTIISGFLLFTIIGPVGRVLADAITYSLLWLSTNLGVFGFATFAGIQQIIVITGLHHLFGAIENQLIVDTGTNFINPLASVAVAAQGGAVLGYMLLHWKNIKTRELALPAFTSTLFGVSEPAIFGITLRYKYPLIAGCISSAAAGAYVYLTGLTSLAYGTTGVPGFAIVSPENNGHLNYIIAHSIAIIGGLVLTYIWGTYKKRVDSKLEATENNVN
ncbi:TPA: PTS transporter subunit EIIC [Streptococcus pyogenes]|nr:PTS transporter subunit EIIC [Streptococcus pyogenes]